MRAGATKISVIIPTYNYGAFLPRALESVFHQDGHDLEVIVVDDGSTDNTPDVMRPWTSRVRYVRQVNQGPAAARNRGIQEATGGIVAFLDADDCWLPGKLDRQVALLRSSDAVHACHTAFVVSNGNGGGERLSRHWTMPGFHPGVAELLRDCRVNTSTVVARRSLFERVGTFQARLGTAEDWNMWLRMVLHGYEMYYLPEPTVRTHIHGRNTHVVTSASVQVARAEAMLRAVCTEFGDRVSHGFQRDVPALLQYWHARLAHDRGDRGAFFRHMAMAVWRRPSLGARLLAGAVSRRWSPTRVQGDGK